MFLNWLFANRISRRPVATWEGCVGPTSLHTTGLQSRGNVGNCALMRCGCRINSAGRAGVFGFVSALESRYHWKRLTDLCLSSRSTPAPGPVRNPEPPEFSPPRYGQSDPLFAAVHESAIGPFETCRSLVWMSAFRAKAEVARTLPIVANGPTRTERAAPVREPALAASCGPRRSPKQPKRWTPTPLHIRDFANRHGSDVDSPIRHANPDQHTHIQEVPHRRAVPHRPDIHQSPLAAALR
ncbi:hypothetical protein V1278_000067 [Bradyrhizobium sp. AZCC 1577]